MKSRLARRYSKAIRSLETLESLEPRQLLSAVFNNSLSLPIYVLGAPSASNDLSPIAVADDGSIWYRAADRQHLMHRLASGAETQFTPALDGGLLAGGLTIGPDHNVWFVISTNKQQAIARMTPTGDVALVTPYGSASIWQLAGSSDGIWFTQGNDVVGEVTVAGNVSNYSVTGGNGFSGLTIGPDDRPWFAGDTISGFTGYVGSIDTDGGLVLRQLTHMPSQPFVGADGQVVVGWSGGMSVIETDGTVNNISLTATPTFITLGSDGHLWFIDDADGINPLARYNNDGTVDHFAVTLPYPGIHGMASSSDGKLYFTSKSGLESVNPTADLRGTGRKVITETRKDFSGVVGTLSDLAGAGSYVVTIDWGDGESSAGTLVANNHGGYDIIGNHTYKTWGWNAIKLTLRDAASADRQIVVNSVSYVIPPAVAGRGIMGTGSAVKPVSGHLFTGAVGSFAGVDPENFSNYIVTIDWGDGSSSSGTLELVAEDVARVVGSHAYERFGEYTISVTLTEKSGSIPPDWAGAISSPMSGPVYWAVAYNSMAMPGYFPTSGQTSYTTWTRASVSQGELDGHLAGSAYDGTTNNGPWAIFSTTNPESAGFLHARISWNGGEETDADIEWTSDSTFVVRSPHYFTSLYNSTVRITVYDSRDASLVGFVGGYVPVNSHILAVIPQGHATAGEEFNGSIGSLKLLTPLPDGTTLTATVSWGDGSTSVGTLVPTGDGTYDIQGQHTYVTTGFPTEERLSVSIVETRPGTDAAAGERFIAYAANLISIAPGTFDGFFMQRSVTYNDLNLHPGDTSTWVVALIATCHDDLTPDDFTGTITWKDGTSSPVTFVHDGGGYWHAVTTRTFGDAGPYTGTLSITALGETHTLGVSRYVTDIPYQQPQQPLGTFSLLPVHAVKGLPTDDMVVGYFAPSDPSATGFTVSSSSFDQISLVKLDNGTYEIHAQGIFIHQSTQYDYRWFYVSISQNGKYVGATGNLYVRRDPDLINADPALVDAFRQREEFTAKLATFTAPAGQFSPSDFTVDIDWGNGTHSAGTVTRGYGGIYEITGTHADAREGTFDVWLTINGPAGTGPVRTKTSITLLHNSVVVTPAENPDVDGFTIKGTIATFVDIDNVTNSDTTWYSYAGLVEWGDGTSSNATLIANGDGSYSVQASHTYAADGDFSIRLTILRTDHSIPGLQRTFRMDFALREAVAVVYLDGFVANAAYAGAVAVDSKTSADPSRQVGRNVWRIHIGSGSTDSPQESGGSAGSPAGGASGGDDAMLIELVSIPSGTTTTSVGSTSTTLSMVGSSEISGDVPSLTSSSTSLRFFSTAPGTSDAETDAAQPADGTNPPAREAAQSDAEAAPKTADQPKEKKEEPGNPAPGSHDDQGGLQPQSPDTLQQASIELNKLIPPAEKSRAAGASWMGLMALGVAGFLFPASHRRSRRSTAARK